MVGADWQPCFGALLCTLFHSHQTATSSVSPLSQQRHQSRQMLVHPPPNHLLAAVAWMTWTCWARPCCSSLCLQNLNKCDGKTWHCSLTSLPSISFWGAGQHFSALFHSLLSLCPCREKQQPPPRLTLRDLQNRSSSGTTVHNPSAPPVLQSVSPNPTLPLTSELPVPATLPKAATTAAASAAVPPRPPATVLPQEISLANITVPLESIKPSEPGKKRGAGLAGVNLAHMEGKNVKKRLACWILWSLSLVWSWSDGKGAVRSVPSWLTAACPCLSHRQHPPCDSVRSAWLPCPFPLC